MRLAILGAGLLLLGGVALVTGILPTADALAVADRVWPILLFAVAITVVAELASEAGVFSAIAERTARAARGRAWLLWLLVVLVAVVSTAFLSLDTTAVLLTPVVVIVAQAQRSQKRNREEALERLLEMIREAAIRPQTRRPTKPTKASKERRLVSKDKRSSIKAGRARPGDD